MTDYLALPLGENAPGIVTAVIETARRRITKYDRGSQTFHPVKPVHFPVHYPGNYGFITQTADVGGDPLGILMLGDDSALPGYICRVRPIGLLEILDHGVQYERVLACVTGNPRFGRVRNYTDVQANLLREIEHFLSIYRAPKGRRAKVSGWKDRRAAHESIRSCHSRFMSGGRIVQANTGNERA